MAAAKAVAVALFWIINPNKSAPLRGVYFFNQKKEPTGEGDAPVFDLRLSPGFLVGFIRYIYISLMRNQAPYGHRIQHRRS